MRRRPVALAAAAAFIAAIVAGVVFYVQTDYGTVRVEVLDESLRVQVTAVAGIPERNVKFSARVTQRMMDRAVQLGKQMKDLQQLEGRWRAVSLELEGKEPGLRLQDLEIIVQDGQIAFYDSANADPGHIDLQPATTPKQLDVYISRQLTLADRAKLGIYNVEGGVIGPFAWPPPDSPAPRSSTPTPESTAAAA